MLTSPVSRAVYSKFASAPDGFTEANLPLAAKSAMMIYRKVGRAEARQFIAMIEVIRAMDKLAS